MTDNDGTHSYTYDDKYQLTNATHPQAFNPGNK
jgi:YD repeat-containing protein